MSVSGVKQSADRALTGFMDAYVEKLRYSFKMILSQKRRAMHT